jgi:hypothetical protein
MCGEKLDRHNLRARNVHVALPISIRELNHVETSCGRHTATRLVQGRHHDLRVLQGGTRVYQAQAADR